ncbi:hypothetical protein [Leekyejoonella antrihumi]|uniref:Lipoprotein n=1 Tax=Leekyejoonella antrihumi TaxID=1660198 RepID=A0A563DWZ4_9MICO|nr:hypothetical protein [Leekyejoonella antrihumi]TWP34453.1 hypothetical protein FGL98_17200 [Leekyejoonella antrihumi]
MNTRRALTTGAAAVMLLAVVTACSSGGDKTGTSPTSTPVSSTPTTSTRTAPPAPTTTSVDPAAEPAITAYTKYYAADAEAAKHPLGVAGVYAGAANFLPYTFDPWRSKEMYTLLQYHSNGVKFVGTPGHPRVTVNQVSPTRVRLWDCPTVGSGWQPVYAKTGKPYGSPPPASFPKPPYLVSVTVIKVNDRWGVSQVTDSSKTCVPGQH